MTFKIKYIFLILFISYFLSAFYTLLLSSKNNFDFFGFQISKVFEVVRLLLFAILFLFIYYKKNV